MVRHADQCRTDADTRSIRAPNKGPRHLTYFEARAKGKHALALFIVPRYDYLAGYASLNVRELVPKHPESLVATEPALSWRLRD